MSECPASISGHCLQLTEGFTLCREGECDREVINSHRARCPASKRLGCADSGTVLICHQPNPHPGLNHYDAQGQVWWQQADATPKLFGVEACKHCARPIFRCPNPSEFCKGWIHGGYAARPVGVHYCGGRSINPVAEPELFAGNAKDPGQPPSPEGPEG